MILKFSHMNIPVSIPDRLNNFFLFPMFIQVHFAYQGATLLQLIKIHMVIDDLFVYVITTRIHTFQ